MILQQNIFVLPALFILEFSRNVVTRRNVYLRLSQIANSPKYEGYRYKSIEGT